ncbi:MAG: NifB/NifX family molybdenum-iron cluster-binding protein [Melioribacteraceae bacterium]|nr:NifB/NifX family molybdenum-iron cluster-binding protein [Melioribacteraceae bacterium]
MRIAVASDDNINVTGHVGKCRAFLILDVENGEVLNKEIRKNSFTDHALGVKDQSHHGNGHGNNDGHKRLAEGLKDCKYLISHGMGWKLVEDIKSFGIEPLVTSEINAERAAILLEEGKLKMRDNLICR